MDDGNPNDPNPFNGLSNISSTSKAEAIGIGVISAMKKLFFYFFFLIFLITGCASSNKCISNDLKQDSFNKIFSDTEFNKDLMMVYLPEKPDPVKIGQELLTAIFNQSLNAIKIDLDKDLQIMTFEKDEWIIIRNRVEYKFNSNFVNLQVSTSKFIDFKLNKIIPDITNTGKPVDIRVVVTGQEIIGSSQKNVGAYFDLTISP